MFLGAQMFLSGLGHTVTLTSPRWAVRRRYMVAPDWSMPPPMLNENDEGEAPAGERISRPGLSPRSISPS
jgi:hypothetical protein